MSHHTTEGVSSDEDVVAGETSGTQRLDGVIDVVVNEDGLGLVKEELRETNPDLLALGGTLGLNSGSKVLIGRVVTIHTVDPDDSDVLTLGGGGGHDDGAGISDGSGGGSNSHGDKVSHLFYLLIISEKGISKWRP